MLSRFQQSILKMISSDESIEATSDRICREAQSFAPDAVCSMVTVDRAGRLHPLAGPSLPARYAAALDGIAIGPEVGSCGSAAYLGRPVSVTDISTDHRWAPYKFLAEPLGLKACWSSPILGSARVVGAFGLYYRERRGPSAEEQRIVAECTDLSAILLDRQESRAENFRLKYLDTLTGLGNWAGLERAILRAAEAGRTVGLVLADVERLRDVNDEHGYSTGDALLVRIARRLQGEAWSGQVFRLQGGEFAILLDEVDSEAALSRVAGQAVASLRHPIACEGQLIAAALTCGGALHHPLQPDGPDMLRWRAGLALHHAKETGARRFALFTEDLANLSKRRFQAMQITNRALSEGRVEAHYQPLTRLDTGEVVGVEALFRVRTLQGNVVPAGQLAPALRAAATACLVTDRMLELVARDMRRWLDRGLRLEHVGVNLSRADFQRDDLCETILGAFSRHGVPLAPVVLEVTETTYLDDDDRRVVKAIERLRAEGLRVALDDFGTGYASLSHLLSFPADIIKADKSLVDQLAPGSSGEAVLRALVEMAKGLGLMLLVEGVETREQADHLGRLGYRLGQGFLFGKPVPAAEIERMVPAPAMPRASWLYSTRRPCSSARSALTCSSSAASRSPTGSISVPGRP